MLGIALTDFNNFDQVLDKDQSTVNELATVSQLRASLDIIQSETQALAARNGPPTRVLKSQLSSDLHPAIADLTAWEKGAQPTSLSTRADLQTRVGALLQAVSGLTAARQTQIFAQRLLPAEAEIGLKMTAYAAGMDQKLNSGDRTVDRFRTRDQHRLIIGLMAGTALLFAGLFWLMATRVTAPLQKASDAILRLSEGDLDMPLPQRSEGKDEIAALWNAIGVLTFRAKQAKITAEALERLHQEREMQLRAVFVD
ncbi:HAMP domain-containing protein [Asticcacaulis sp. EMRT-3]|uniref:HAMP domain-containing protein n=1 Tax=Asticcacaulis sp. EMRT-3 TaxID=3040349 RepID=UPI0024AEA811|nr:HAMP domain-containing protein [Asticcacaulis sp. EMRT-3]MDI7776669.1 HAMP domain-containing protein [Asticcacaulis sp. EMRT-3]